MKSKTPWSGIVDAAFFPIFFYLLVNEPFGILKNSTDQIINLEHIYKF